MITSFLFLSVSAFLVCILIVPFWLYLHYKSRSQIHINLSIEEKQQLQQLENEAKQLAQRINTLEALLDYHQPNWRTDTTNP
ncbi:envelope stress response membrane protein PspB [Conservatibacter flavescens]|uniref:Envelope stress response membrane protein PspB n=1 Tax=Conservatibacter flavescens TaxID=28161 RepID=A0A2M8S085_9PAST|nr:envelope stress response membrane protein PspB [Conservatibacter flavescens]PJG84553.1 envelope stress response membrane protein PspB [Conservatibacter flavescens]